MVPGEEIEFRIVVHCPVALTVESAKDVVASAKPKWVLTRIALQRIRENEFEIKVGLAPGSLQREKHRELVEFRDAFLSLLALIAVVPVRPLMKGTFTFPMGAGKYAQISLGPMNYVFPEKPLLSLAPFVEGFALEEVYLVAVWFFWQAINSSEPIHRFLNVAVAYELVVATDTELGGSKPPKCSSCGSDVSPCPHCGRNIRIPTTLRERAGFLFSDEGLRDAFIRFRNRIFHGRLADLNNAARDELAALNTALLVNLRNYLGDALGLTPIAVSDVGLSVNTPNVFVTVFYQTNDHKEGS